jgi:hypothetical protein
MSGGKGGSETTQTEQKMDPEFKKAFMKSFETGEMLSKQAPIPYSGITQVAPSDATKQAWTNVGNSANLLGVGLGAGNNIADGLPKHEFERGGIKGYGTAVGHTQNLANAWQDYPELMQELEDYMPGVMTPGTRHRENYNWFKNRDPNGEFQQSRKKNKKNGVMDYDDIMKTYRGRMNI